MPASIPCGILIHPAVWPQRTWAKNWWLCPFWGELGPHLTQRGRGRGVRPCQVKLCTAHDAYVQCVHGAAQQPMTLLIFAYTVVLCIAVFAGLAIDVGRRKLYYSVDEGSANAGEVGELSTDGTDRKVLNHQNRSVPQSVVIDIDNR